VEAEVSLRQQQIEAVRRTVARLADEHEQLETVIRLDGLEAVRERLTQLADSARFECLSFSPGGPQPADTTGAEAPLNSAALSRGVRIRNVYQDSYRNDPATVTHARAMAALGSQSRTVPTLPMRLVVVDREVALVPTDPQQPREGALEIRSTGLVAGLVALFEQVWQQGTPLGDARRGARLPVAVGAGAVAAARRRSHRRVGRAAPGHLRPRGAADHDRHHRAAQDHQPVPGGRRGDQAWLDVTNRG
jgi:hypothetical protein